MLHCITVVVLSDMDALEGSPLGSCALELSLPCLAVRLPGIATSHGHGVKRRVA